MKRIIRTLLPALLGASVALATGCAPAQEEEPLEEDSAAIGELGRLGPKAFRNTFAHYLRKDGLDDDAIHDVVYLAPEEVTDPKIDPDPAAPLARLDARFRGIRPSALYQHGRDVPIRDVVDVEGALAARPVHIVVLPGIFGEFIDVAPFEEVYQAKSSAARVRWERLIAEKAASPDATDATFDPKLVKEAPRSLASLVRTGSIDDADGKPLVTVSYMVPPLGSLESLGTLEDNAAVYLRRLRKYFALVGANEDVYVLGYSRGAATALEVVAQATQKPADNPWTGKLKGVISLAGVLYGSQLADTARAKGSAQADVIDVLAELGKDLESCTADTPTTTRLRIQAANGARWTAAVAKAGYKATKLGSHPEIAWEAIESDSPDLARMTTFARKLLVDDVFTLASPLADYCPNVDRFKAALTKTVAGIDTLTTAARLDWWRTHTLPTNIRYFALAGTMGDATRQPGHTWAHAQNASSYDPTSIDFKSLRTNYYDLLDASGIEANDSQVTVNRAKFWPSLMPVLNSRQRPLDTYFMGTVGSHHWGLAFPRAFATKDGRTANPYPRTALLHSIGAFVSLVAQHEGR